MIATKVATERREQASRMQEKEELIRALEARLQSALDACHKTSRDEEAALGQLTTLRTKLSEEQMVSDRQRKTIQRLERELAAAGTSVGSAAIPTPSAARSNSQPPSRA